MADKTVETKKKPQPRARAQRTDFVQTRKSLPYTLRVQSNALLGYMTRHGGAAAGAFQRVAGLIQLTANDDVVRKRLDQWFEGITEIAVERATALSAQQEKFSEDIVVGVARPKIPENYKYTVEITHPVFWKFIGLVEMIDGVMAEMEFLWLAGQLEDVHLKNATGQAVNTIRTLVNRIYYVTNASRNRKGGLYSPESYKELMKALSKNEEIQEAGEQSEEQTVSTVEESASVAQKDVATKAPKEEVVKQKDDAVSTSKTPAKSKVA